MDRANAPKHIDYLSLDIEGAEGLALHENFPFHKYQFSIITIERPKFDLWQRLLTHGYLFHANISNFGETLWYHKSITLPTDFQNSKNDWEEFENRKYKVH